MRDFLIFSGNAIHVNIVYEILKQRSGNNKKSQSYIHQYSFRLSEEISSSGVMSTSGHFDTLFNNA